jgi:hypothetical protein
VSVTTDARSDGFIAAVWVATAKLSCSSAFLSFPIAGGNAAVMSRQLPTHVEKPQKDWNYDSPRKTVALLR